MSALLDNFQANSKMHVASRAYKDGLFLPFAKAFHWFHVSPALVSVLGFALGILSIWLLFYNYWYFVIVITISTFLDGVDGALARYTKQVSDFGKQLDYYIDLSLMTLMYIAISIWVNDVRWLAGLSVFFMVLALSKILKTNVTIFPGRMWLFVPVLVGLPIIGLMSVILYSVIALFVVLKTTFQKK